MLNRLFKPYRTQEEAKALVGQTVRIRSDAYIVSGFNDLGCLYGNKVTGRKSVSKREYVLEPWASEQLN